MASSTSLRHGNFELLGHRVDSSESRKVSVFSGRSKSPLYEDRQEWSFNEGSSPAGTSNAIRGFYNETRSPRYAQGSSRYGGCRGSPRCNEIVDSRVRYDDPGSARRQDNHSFSRREPLSRSRSSDHQMDRSASSVVHPVIDTLGKNAPALQKIASSSGMASVIDFSMDSEPSNAVAAPNMQQVPPSTDAETENRVKDPEGRSLQRNQSSLFSTSDNSFSAQQITRTVEASNIQAGTSSPMHNAQQSSNISTQQSSQAISKLDEETRFEGGVQALSAETKSSGRKELSEDLFTASHVSAPAAVQGWQNGLPYGTGFGLRHYPNAMFPSMTSLLEALPSVQHPRGLAHAPSFDSHSSEMASHSSYLASPMNPESRCTSAMPSVKFTFLIVLNFHLDMFFSCAYDEFIS
ncbi:hypothetical protein DITRI_Ditri10aG0163900 [Diplodiscus trichospermus]